MNPRTNSGLGVALSFTSLCLSFSLSALAQDETTTAAGASADATTAAPAGSASATTEATSDAPPDTSATETTEATETGATETQPAETQPAEAEPVQEPAKKTAKVEVKANLAELDGPSAPAAKADSDQKILAVVQLPGSASPSVQIRGITNGSLWRTFHGQQFPYMPEAGNPSTVQIGLSGYFWNDLSNTRIDVDKSLADANVNDQNRWTTQTRGVLRVTPTVNAGNGWFAQGNGELVVQGDMQPDPTTGVLGTTDDLWVRVGKWDVFDVTVGRFQGWEIANHYGMALDINTLERSGAWIVTSSLPRPTDGYGLSYFWDRQNNLLGGYAVHVYPTKYLRGELLGHVGAGSSANAANPYQIDVRPAGIFDIGWLKLKAGWEYGKATPQDANQKVRESKNGYGFAAQFVFKPYVEFGGSFARGFQDVIDKDEQADLAASNTVQTAGGFLNASPGHEPLVFGIGAFLNQWKDMRLDGTAGPHFNKVDTNDQWLIFGAAQYTLWSRLNLKFVVSHASNKVGDYKAGSYTNNALSGRLRAEVLF